jgi:chromosomal replication initiation ATPase DnaA
MRTIEYIEAIICEENHIEPANLHIKTRKESIREPRQIIVYLALLEGIKPLEIAIYFGQNHSTISLTKKRIKEITEVDRHFREKIEYYIKLVNSDKDVKLTILSCKLEKIKREGMELMAELEKIKI